MPNDELQNSPAERFEYAGWDIALVLDRVQQQTVSGHADLYKDGVHKCRIALCTAQLDRAAALSSLTQKAKTFVDEWLKEPHTGDSGFADL